MVIITKTGQNSFKIIFTEQFLQQKSPFFAVLMYALYSPTHQTFQVQAKISNTTAYLSEYLSVSYDYATGNFSMPILYALESTRTTLPPYDGDFSKIGCVEFNLCCFFPSVNAVNHRRWNFVRKCFTASMLQQLFNYQLNQLNLPV